MYRKIEEELKKWKADTNRKPLLLYGARQVGKTYTLLKFGEDCFENYVYVNLEIEKGFQEIFQGNNSHPDRILRLIEAISGKEISPQKTLLILDEIQSCPPALTSLKYFCEEAQEYCVVAAGSLLGVALERQQFSFPVGKVHSVTMYPMDFEEFLLANGKEILVDEIYQASITCNPLPEVLHNQALELYRYYLILGGMPAVINKFLQDGKLLWAVNEQQEILSNYVGDMAKYATASETVKIKAAFDSIPAQLAKDNKKFQYKLIQRGATGSLFGVALDWLEQAGIVLKCWRLGTANVPAEAYRDLSAFKLYMGDVGLLAAKAGVAQRSILANENNTFSGAMVENYVAQQLKSLGYRLYYWAPSDSMAELDFLVEIDGRIIPIECKGGVHNRSRSLGIFCRKYTSVKAIRFSADNFYNTNNVECLPLYAIFCLKKKLSPLQIL